MFAVLFLFCCKVRCSHSYVTIVVWLWHLTLTKSILTCILPRNPNSHTAKIWSGLSKCRNISGIPEEICPGPQLNQEKAATLAQICHRKSVFLAQTLPKTFMRSWRWEEEAARCLCFGAQHRKDKKRLFSVCLDKHAAADHTSIQSALLMHFQTAATPLAELSVYDLAHGWVFDLHPGCATCCSWLNAAVFHQRKIRSTLDCGSKDDRPPPCCLG